MELVKKTRMERDGGRGRGGGDKGSNDVTEIPFLRYFRERRTRFLNTRIHHSKEDEICMIFLEI